MTKRIIFLKALFIFLATSSGLFSEEILVNTHDGETFILEVDQSESLGALKEKIIAFTEVKDQSILIEIPGQDEIVMNYSVAHQGGYLGSPRNYISGVNAVERADIRYLVTFLANKSLISIAMAKSDLESAGDRIDHVHPLRFLETIFTDEELKVGIRNIRGKGWVWNHFATGLKESLATEHSIGNLETYISDFSQTVGIDMKLIAPLVAAQTWDDLIDTLIQKIPRKGDQDRYDFNYVR